MLYNGDESALASLHQDISMAVFKWRRAADFDYTNHRPKQWEILEVAGYQLELACVDKFDAQLEGLYRGLRAP
jgi:hypothetical protein